MAVGDAHSIGEVTERAFNEVDIYSVWHGGGVSIPSVLEEPWWRCL